MTQIGCLIKAGLKSAQVTPSSCYDCQGSPFRRSRGYGKLYLLSLLPNTTAMPSTPLSKTPGTRSLTSSIHSSTFVTTSTDAPLRRHSTLPLISTTGPSFRRPDLAEQPIPKLEKPIIIPVTCETLKQIQSQFNGLLFKHFQAVKDAQNCGCQANELEDYVNTLVHYYKIASDYAESQTKLAECDCGDKYQAIGEVQGEIYHLLNVGNHRMFKNCTAKDGFIVASPPASFTTRRLFRFPKWLRNLTTTSPSPLTLPSPAATFRPILKISKTSSPNTSKSSRQPIAAIAVELILMGS
ncbi:hypothetical protein L596_009864 [Steinernema carpocapsae]|uniref:Uncharacterized protein n=1 Tax=Steinernema carpocapsae TaxID=34508 RepID=A0A4U5PH38_STECR|nr:hypothetical protein L596_009864 [Steinernema carpocapsae]